RVRADLALTADVATRATVLVGALNHHARAVAVDRPLAAATGALGADLQRATGDAAGAAVGLVTLGIDTGLATAFEPGGTVGARARTAGERERAHTGQDHQHGLGREGERHLGDPHSGVHRCAPALPSTAVRA